MLIRILSFRRFAVNLPCSEFYHIQILIVQGMKVFRLIALIRA